MNQTNKISSLLSNFNLVDFIAKNKHTTASEYILGYKGNQNKLNWYLAEQLIIYPKAKHKIPAFVQKYCWFTQKSYEQASSQLSAIYKSKLISGKTCLDLSGGLGVDDWAFSQTFDKVISLDPDLELNEMVRFNFEKLEIKNCERLDSTAEKYLENCKDMFDLIYLDADRRITGKRSFQLSDGAPNYEELAPKINALGRNILLKLSPLADIHYLIKNLSPIKTIIVISVQQEVKEILVLLEPGNLTYVNIKAVDIDEKKDLQSFSGTPSQIIETPIVELPGFFFEPAPSVIKAGLSIAYANHLHLNQLAQNTAFYIGLNPIKKFMGRQFTIVNSFEFSKSKFNNYLKTQQIQQANITRRNFNLSVEELRKSFKIKEGGDDYLFFGTLQNGTKMVYHCRK
ncbi:MAG: hypothetical protein Q8M15_12545 [Bacteroidota bacterium]|nr:hypothetical protein [Bacteroidota bacterium]